MVELSIFRGEGPVSHWVPYWGQAALSARQEVKGHRDGPHWWPLLLRYNNLVNDGGLP